MICPNEHEWWNCQPNPLFFQDPCCNWELRRFQCCAPRTISATRTVAKTVYKEKIAGYVYARGRQQSSQRMLGRMQEESHAGTLMDRENFPVAYKNAVKRKLLGLTDQNEKAMRDLSSGVSDAVLKNLVRVALNAVNTYVD